MPVRFIALDTETVRRLQNGGADAYGNKPVSLISDGSGVPCRHCLQPVVKGDLYLALAYSPFDKRQPYAETGPIFLHKSACKRATDSTQPSSMYAGRNFILRGYRDNDWINYEVAQVVPTEMLQEIAENMLARADVAYLHMRSAEFNCFHCRVERI